MLLYAQKSNYQKPPNFLVQMAVIDKSQSLQIVYLLYTDLVSRTTSCNFCNVVGALVQMTIQVIHMSMERSHLSLSLSTDLPSVH